MGSVFEFNKMMLISSVIGLMILNWLVEAYKWKLLVSKIEKINIFFSLKSVLIGLSVGMLTPSRIGEFGGKVFFLKRADRVRAFFIAMLSSFSQLLTTIFFGCIGIVYYLLNYTSVKGVALNTVIIGLIALIGIILFLYFNISFVGKKNNILTKLGKYRLYFFVFKSYKSNELVIVLVYSFLRYLIFSTQFYLLLILFEVNINYLPALMLIGVSYVVMSVVPTIALADIGVRGAISVFFIGLASPNSLGIISASTLLWVINLAIPALFGSFFIYQLKLNRKTKER